MQNNGEVWGKYTSCIRWGRVGVTFYFLISLNIYMDKPEQSDWSLFQLFDLNTLYYGSYLMAFFKNDIQKIKNKTK